MVLFALVLGAALLAADRARRLTAHASPSPPAIHTTVSAAKASDTAQRQPGFPPSVVHHPIRVATTPPAIKARGTGVLPAESPKPHLTSSSAAGSPTAFTPAAPSTHTFHDKKNKISFDYPANWTFTQKDHEISTFRLDARTVERKTALRAVAAIPENPFPASTFTGAYVYLSVTPHSNQARCAQQAVAAAGSTSRRLSELGGMSFVHGHDEQKHICTVERDEIYTTYRKGACYRFDLAINNFCGGEVSGVKDVTDDELESVRTRMEAIVSTVRFDSK